MSKERILNQYKDIVEPRRVNNDAIGFMTRQWQPQLSHKVNRVFTPSQLKTFTAKNAKLDQLLDELSPILKRSKTDLQKDVVAMLDEIGLSRRMYIVRWLGLFTTKVICRMYTSIFVNERNIFNLKGSMGQNPVIFVPTHRSYGDIVLMTYISYYYDIDLPAVAAGMDFHSMVGMGRIMRDTGAFYMRRTFATDKLYGAVFRQYVRTLVTNHHTPLEFFIEGTRSRSGKSLSPKYGFMSMVLEPLFSNDISDITFVPINISYEKILEEKLFAYELLGVPKPKESTSGLFKALNILSEHFGSIYVNVGEPFSAKEFLGTSLKRTIDPIKPIEIQTISPEQNFLVQNMAHEIVYRQQRGAIVTTFQLVAVALTMSLHSAVPLTEQELAENIIWLANILRNLGGNVFDYDEENLKKELKETLSVHSNLVKKDKEDRLRLISSVPFILTDDIQQRMKGHQLSVHTMSTIVPVVMIQLYVNSILHWVTSSAVIHLIIAKKSVTRDTLWKDFSRLRNLLRYEFPVNDRTQPKEFETTLNYLIEIGAVKEINSSSDVVYGLGENGRVNKLLNYLAWPFLTSVYRICLVLLEKTSIEEKDIMKSAQRALEWQLTNKDDIHPYCLSLDCIFNCVQGLVAEGVLAKERNENTVLYTINSGKLANIFQWVEQLTPNIKAKFDASNPVMMDQREILARL